MVGEINRQKRLMQAQTEIIDLLEEFEMLVDPQIYRKIAGKFQRLYQEMFFTIGHDW